MSVTISNTPWYRPRGTFHFDMPISLEKAKAIIAPPNVEHHSFLPFIRREKKSRAKDGNPKWKIRYTMYASHRNSHIFSYYNFLLQPLYEAKINCLDCSDSIRAYRKLRKSNIHFAKEAFEEIKQRRVGVAIAMDVKGFFDYLRHDILKKQWQSLLNMSRLPDDHYAVFKAITRYSFVDQTQAYSHRQLMGIKGLCSIQEMRSVIQSGRLKIGRNGTRLPDGSFKWNTVGIPQGSPMSGLLANIHMIDFDEKLTEAAKRKNARYWRYSDDILVVCDACDRTYFEKLIRDSLQAIGLKENPTKTNVAEFSNINGVFTVKSTSKKRGLQYLGFEYDGQRILIRSETLSRHKIKAKHCIKKELAFAKRHGLPRIRRKKIYSYYSHLLNTMVKSASAKCQYKHRNFHTYVKSAARILQSEAITRQMRKHWSWLGVQIKKANDKLP
jgi:hypothetical protein